MQDMKGMVYLEAHAQFEIPILLKGEDSLEHRHFSNQYHVSPFLPAGYDARKTAGMSRNHRLCALSQVSSEVCA
jgi:hypothetical protein